MLAITYTNWRASEVGVTLFQRAKRARHYFSEGCELDAISASEAKLTNRREKFKINVMSRKWKKI